ncbi:MAG: hypothetical protein ABW185_14880 [Sedimenticola sp.]
MQEFENSLPTVVGSVIHKIVETMSVTNKHLPVVELKFYTKLQGVNSLKRLKNVPVRKLEGICKIYMVVDGWNGLTDKVYSYSSPSKLFYNPSEQTLGGSSFQI